MSRTGNPSNLFPKSKGKLDDAEMEMDDLDEDQANVDDDGEEEFDDQDQEGFQDLDEDDQDLPQQDSRVDLGYRAPQKPPQQAGKPTGGQDLPKNQVPDTRKPLEASNIRDDYMRGNPNQAPRQPTGSQDLLQPIQKPAPKGDLSKPPNSNSIEDITDANRAFGKAGNPNQQSRSDNLRGESPQPQGKTPTSDQKKPPEAVTYDSDPQFQQYLTTLTEYDRSRYNQLLKKNVQLREELKKIADQTEILIKKER